MLKKSVTMCSLLGTTQTVSHDGYYEKKFTIGKIPVLRLRWVRDSKGNYSPYIRDYDTGKLIWVDKSIRFENSLLDEDFHWQILFDKAHEILSRSFIKQVKK